MIERNGGWGKIIYSNGKIEDDEFHTQ